MKSHKISTASKPPHAQASRRLVRELEITSPWLKNSENSTPFSRESSLIWPSRISLMALHISTVLASDSLEISMMLQSRPFNRTTKSFIPYLMLTSAISPSLKESVTGNCRMDSRSLKRDPSRITNLRPDSSTVPADPSTLSPLSLVMSLRRSIRWAQTASGSSSILTAFPTRPRTSTLATPSTDSSRGRTMFSSSGSMSSS